MIESLKMQNNSDAISRKASIDILHKYFDDMLETDTICPQDLYGEFEALKPIPERIAQWIYGEDNTGQDGWKCSKCGFFIPWYYEYYGLDNIDFIRDYHVCPKCESKMLTYTGKDR